MASPEPAAMPASVRWTMLAPLTLWAAALIVLSPRGEFPLNDDWIYSGAVQQWLETGHYGGHPFSTASLFSQAGWGALFCSLFGFSFTTLRWSTLVLWLVAALTTGAMARRLGASTWASALAGCLVIANPLAFNLAYTFMTDVPFMAFMALAGYGYLRALEEGKLRWLLWGSIFGACALLTRQFAILILAAFLVSCLPAWRARRERENIGRVAALLVPWILGLAILWGLPGDTAELGHRWIPAYLGRTLTLQLFGGVKFYVASLVYLALFALPILVGAAWAYFREPGSRWKLSLGGIVVAFVAMMAIVLALPPSRLPFFGNILYDLGLGPMTLRGIQLPSGQLWMPDTWDGAWWIPTMVGLIVGAWILVASVSWLATGRNPKATENPNNRSQQRFLALWVVLVILALYHPFLPVRFDRYLLGTLVPLLVLAASARGANLAPVKAVQVVLLLAIFSFSLAAQHDYFAWNRTRWDALNALMAAGVPPEEIEGGYEFNGWYTSPHFIEAMGARAFLDSGPKGWWVVGDTYAIAWHSRGGYAVQEKIPYDNWLTPDSELLVLKRE